VLPATFVASTPAMKRRLRIRIIAMAMLAGAPGSRSISAETSPAIPVVRGSEVDAVGKGQALYVRLCSRCHGTNMITPGNVAYDLRQFPHDAKARFVQSVMQGKNGRMPPWGDLLSPDDVDELWTYVKTGGKQ
jgi:mono/diheme cytochrome c family protein